MEVRFIDEGNQSTRKRIENYILKFIIMQPISLWTRKPQTLRLYWCNREYVHTNFALLLSGFRIFLEINQPETRIANGGHVC